MSKNIISQKFIYPSPILRKTSVNNIGAIDINELSQQVPSIFPRVFSLPHIPVKVALSRAVKQYNKFDLSTIAQNIDWNIGSGQLQLINYNVLPDYYPEFACFGSNIPKGLVFSRAFHKQKKSYTRFSISDCDINYQYYEGIFENESQKKTLHRLYICFDCQNPLEYLNRLQKALQRRAEVITALKYNFCLDMMDKDTLIIPYSSRKRIIKLIGRQLPTQMQIAICDHYQRTMNKILLNSYLSNKINNLIQIPQNEQKNNHRVQYNKILTIIKNDKTFKIEKKGVSMKIKEIITTGLINNSNVIRFLQMAIKILNNLQKVNIFRFSKQQTLQYFLMEHLEAAELALVKLKQQIIYPIARLLREQLQQYQMRGFKIYTEDFNAYLQSKVRRIIIRLNQMIKDKLKSLIIAQINRYKNYIIKNSVKIEHINSLKQSFEPTNLPIFTILIQVQLFHGKFQFSITPLKLYELIITNIYNILKIFQQIPSIQSTVMKELFKNRQNNYINIKLLKSISLYKAYKDQNNKQQIQNQFQNNINKKTNYQQKWLQSSFNILQKQIYQLAMILNKFNSIFRQLEQKIQINKILNDDYIKDYHQIQIEQIIQFINYYQKIKNIIQQQLQKQYLHIGFFKIDFTIIKAQLIDICNNKLKQCKQSLINKYNFSSLKLQNQLKDIKTQIQVKPNNIYSIINQDSLINNFVQIIAKCNQKQQELLYNLCQKYSCKLSTQSLMRKWINKSLISSLYQIKQQKRRELNQIKTLFKQQIIDQIEEIEDSIRMIKNTFEIIKRYKQRQSYYEVYQIIQSLRILVDKNINLIKDVNFKQKSLNSSVNNFKQAFELFDKIEMYFLFWSTIFEWQRIHNSFMQLEFSNFDLFESKHRQNQLIEKITKTMNYFNNQQIQLNILGKQIKLEIQSFSENQLKLLKLLKKDGFKKKYLSQIGIHFQGQLNHICLKNTIQLGFLNHLQAIEAVSNEAWNEFHLQQTIQRIFIELINIEFIFTSYKDKKGNEIKLLKNLQAMKQKISEIIINIQAVQSNPMKNMYQKKIMDLSNKSLYIEKSVEICSIFQANLIEIYPIFDSTDIIKQLPQQNKKFTKIIKSCIDLYSYMQKLKTLYDTCNAQNIYQKILSMQNILQQIKSSLINYLHQKRKGFLRFYLLSDIEMFELFSTNSNKQLLNKILKKIFQSITQLQIQQSFIIAICNQYTKLKLNQKIIIKEIKIQNWLTNLYCIITQTIIKQIQNAIKDNTKSQQIINTNCIQSWLINYQITKIHQIQQNQLSKLLQIIQQQQINIVKLSQKCKLLSTQKQKINFNCIVIVIMSKIEVMRRLCKLNIIDKSNFQIIKLIKYNYKENQLFISCFQTSLVYGCQYIGAANRLVVTPTTQKAQLIQMSAIKNGFGGLILGSAGTGKSQITHQLANMCGRMCMMFNCSSAVNSITVSNLLKGMAICGIWMCFQEINRMNYATLSTLATHLSILLAYRSMEITMHIIFHQQPILMDPNFHFNATCNPQYIGRTTLPVSLNRLFRSISIVTIHKKIICTSLLKICGFSNAQLLGQFLSELFDTYDQYWKGQDLYDFGLRNLKSIINLATQLHIQQNKQQSISICQAFKILIEPRILPKHEKIFIYIFNQYFKPNQQLIAENIHTIGSKMEQLSTNLKVKNCIILHGATLSGKTTLMKQFQQKYKEWTVYKIMINSMSIDQLYGVIDLTTGLWNDGLLTRKIRQYSINPQGKLIIECKGTIFSEWVENLNSMLDNTRILSLSSGETISVPSNLKIVMISTNLSQSTPATISRSAIIYCSQFTIENIIHFYCQNRIISEQIIQFLKIITNKLKNHYNIEIDYKFIIYWIKTIHINFQIQITINSFINYLSFILQGILTQQGKQIYKNEINIKINIKNIFNMNYIQQKWLQYQNQIYQNINYNKYFKFNSIERINIISQDIFIPSKQTQKIKYYLQNFLQKDNSKILLFFGTNNCAKTSTFNYLFKVLKKTNYLFNQIYLNYYSKKNNFYKEFRNLLFNRTYNKIGAPISKKLIIWIENISLPIKNNYNISQINELLKNIVLYKGWCCKQTLEFQYIQDIILIGDHTVKTNKLLIQNDLLKLIQPITFNKIQLNQIKFIFQSLIQLFISNSNSINFLNCCEKTIYFYLEIQDLFSNQFCYYYFKNLKNIINSVLQWNYVSINQQKQSVIQKFFIFEIQRILQNKLIHKNEINKFQQILKKYFNINETKIIIHSLQFKLGYNTKINLQKCQQVLNMNDFISQIQCICQQYQISIDQNRSSLVVFPELCVIICQVSRTLSLPQNHLFMVSLPKYGKKTIINLVSYLLKAQIYTTSKKYDRKQWLDQIKIITKKCINSSSSTILLFQHQQLQNHQQKIHISNLLTTMYLNEIYTEADFEQFMYSMQSILIHKGLQINRQNSRKLFIQYLKQNLHIVLMRNPLEKELKSDINIYTNIMKHTQMLWMLQWPITAQYLIVENMITINQNINIFPKIHTMYQQLMQELNFNPVSQGMYLDCIKTFLIVLNKFQKIIQKQKQTYYKAISIIKDTILSLEKGKNRIKSLQPTIIILQKQTKKMVKSLNIEKISAQNISKTLKQKQKDLQQIIFTSMNLKKDLEQKNQIAQERLKKAWQNVELVKPSYIAEIKSLINPSELIRVVITAIVIIIYDGPLQKDKNQIGNQEYYFQTGKKYILSKDSKNICKMLINYEKQKMTMQTMKRLKQVCLNHKKWNQKQAKNANKAIYYFYLWVEAVVLYFQIYNETRPIREQLQKVNKILIQKQKEIEIITKQYLIYQQKVKQISIIHQEKYEKLAQYISQIQGYQIILKRGYEIIQEIEKQKQKWQKYIKEMQNRSKVLFSDALIISVKIVYTGIHIKQIRNKINSKLYQLLECNLISISQNGWIFSKEQLEIYKQLGISQNTFIIDNIKIMQYSPKIILLIDPQQQGYNYLKMYNNKQGKQILNKIRLCSQKYLISIHDTITNGKILLIQFNSTILPDQLLFLIKPKIRKNQKQLNLLELQISNQNWITIDPHYKIYLYTTNSNHHSMDLISCVNCVNFQITFQQLQQKIIDLIILLQYPQLHDQIQNLQKQEIINCINLKQIQNRILNIFIENSSEIILDNDDTLNILITSNRLYNQIIENINLSKQKQKQLIQYRKQIHFKANKIVKYYFHLQKIVKLSQFYSYSLKWYLNVFQKYYSIFVQKLCQELLSALPNHLRIVAYLIIVQVDYSYLPWQLLFQNLNSISTSINKEINFKVSKQSLNQIICRINAVSPYIPNLYNQFYTNPTIFEALLSQPLQTILQVMPSQFSRLDYFYKILLISCFRSDCTVRLVQQWVFKNYGLSFAQKNIDIKNYTQKKCPILTMMYKSEITDVKAYINKLLNSNNQNQRNIILIELDRLPLKDIKQQIETAYKNKQCIILQRINESQDIYNYLYEFYQNMLSTQQNCLLWIIINTQEIKIIPSKFIEFCQKIIIQSNINLISLIAKSFFKELHKLEKNILFIQSNQKNQIKYLLHKLCIFHYMLIQRNKYGKLWRINYQFTQKDLQLNIKYLLIDKMNQIKTLLTNVVVQLTYGTKMIYKADLQILQMYFKQTMKFTNFNRNIFWQSLWGDNNFPTSILQYQHYLKITLKQKISQFNNYYSFYGINHHLIQQQQLFYFKQLQILYPIINNSIILNQFNKQFQHLQFQINHNNNTNNNNIFYNWLLQEQNYYSNIIQNQLKIYGYQKLYLKYKNITILQLIPWIQQFQFILNTLKSIFISLTYEFKIPSINISFVSNIIPFIYTIFMHYKVHHTSHTLYWHQNKQYTSNNNNKTIELNLQQQLLVEVSGWYIWNAHCNNQGHIQLLKKLNYQKYNYQLLPKGYLQVIAKSEIKQLYYNSKFKYKQLSVMIYPLEGGYNPQSQFNILFPICEIKNQPFWIIKNRTHITLRL